MTESVYKPRHSGSLYGAFAYASVVLTCYAGFSASRSGDMSEGRVLVVFALGGLYAALGVLSWTLLDCRGQIVRASYFAVQCALATAVVLLSPSRGFMGILVLPVMSQAIIELRAGYAAIIGLYLFGIDIVTWDGWRGMRDAMMTYVVAFAFTGVFTFITKRAITSRVLAEKLRHEVEEANRQLRERAAETEELATTRERNRVAREIHDGVGHYLTVVKTQLDAAAALLPAQPERAREAVTKAAKLAGDALDDVRRSVGSLRTDEKRPPLPEALRSLALQVGLPVTMRIEGEARSLPAGIEHALFRSAQEGLTNIRKHAAASAAEVALDFRPPGRVTLAVTDNGKGVGGAAGAGFGLVGIRERIEVLGGRVESGNRREGGFALRVEVPA